MEKNNNKNVTDLSYLKQVSNGDNNFIKEMIDVYMQQTPEEINNMENHLKNKDWKMLRAVAHKMKPSCPFFGLNDLHKVVSSIEEYANKEIHLEELPEMIDKVKSTCFAAMAELEQKKILQ